jgi:chemotaxis protein histidine kinase CheA
VTETHKGTVWYGIHMYPGPAEYRPPGQDPFRVLLSEDTIRSMDPSFAGCPVFVGHEPNVQQRTVEQLKAEADGWVVKSFYNEADGKHWCQFIVVSDDANRSIKRGMRLSNAYIPRAYAPGGLWNGMSYDKEVKDASYTHLAIVPDPRYAESQILSPDEFKKYNEEKLAELKTLANANDKESPVKFFKKTKVEDKAVDLETLVVLPKSNKEIALGVLINAMDDYENAKAEPQMANGEHHVEYGGEKMTVNELMAKHAAMCNELAALKEKHKDDEEEEQQNEADKAAAEEAAKKAEEQHQNALKAAEQAAAEAAAKKEAAKKKADELRNAADRAKPETVTVKVDTMDDQVARGRSRYGS